MRDNERILRQLNIDAEYVKPSSHDCCHYGEGCALGYPLYADLNGFGISGSGGIHEDDVLDVKMLNSKAFSDYWRSRNPTAPDSYLPCFHTGCHWEHCNKLNDEQFKSRWLKSRH